jgi:hypothetical protein
MTQPIDPIAKIAADLRAGRIARPVTPKSTPVEYTDAEREAWIADMQATHRPNGRALIGSACW